MLHQAVHMPQKPILSPPQGLCPTGASPASERDAVKGMTHATYRNVTAKRDRITDVVGASSLGELHGVICRGTFCGIITF